MFRIYNKEKIPKEIFTVNLAKEEIVTVLGGNIFIDHPELNKDDCIVLEREKPFINPILENGNIREMTREEKILLLGDTELLLDGEWLEDEKIKKIKYDEKLGYYRKVWNRELNIWEEGTTKEEAIELRKNKIIEYEKLEEEKKLLENSKFSTEDEIKVITEKMTVLEGDINNLQEKIKLL